MPSNRQKEEFSYEQETKLQTSYSPRKWHENVTENSECCFHRFASPLPSFTFRAFKEHCMKSSKCLNEYLKKIIFFFQILN